jgi:hypothetical protein
LLVMGGVRRREREREREEREREREREREKEALGNSSLEGLSWISGA